MSKLIQVGQIAGSQGAAHSYRTIEEQHISDAGSRLLGDEAMSYGASRHARQRSGVSDMGPLYKQSMVVHEQKPLSATGHATSASQKAKTASEHA